MQSTLRIIHCPCCKSVLYSLTANESTGKRTWRLTRDSPAVRTDPQGRFMHCPRCARRIELDMGDELESPGFQVAPQQDCS